MFELDTRRLHNYYLSTKNSLWDVHCCLFTADVATSYWRNNDVIITPGFRLVVSIFEKLTVLWYVRAALYLHIKRHDNKICLKEGDWQLKFFTHASVIGFTIPLKSHHNGTDHRTNTILFEKGSLRCHPNKLLKRGAYVLRLPYRDLYSSLRYVVQYVAWNVSQPGDIFTTTVWREFTNHRGESTQRTSNAESVSLSQCFTFQSSRRFRRRTLHDKQRVLMHRHQGLNVRHGLCHIYMRYLYIYELFIAFVCFVVCSLL